MSAKEVASRIQEITQKSDTDCLLDNIFKEFGGTSFIKLSPIKRAERVAKYLADNADLVKEGAIPIASIPDVGLMVIKPEAQPLRETILKMLQQTVGVDIILTNDTKYSPQTFLDVYGNFLHSPSPEVGITFPPLLFAGSTTMVTAVLFKHPSPDTYSRLKKSQLPNLDLSFLDTETDPQSIFKKLFVGSGECLPLSLRNQIRPYLEKLGFGLIDSELARSFDINGELRFRTSEQNLRTFNGIHAPTDTEECQKQIRIYFNPDQVGSLYHSYNSQ